jgi:cytoskeletal protein RodZ
MTESIGQQLRQARKARSLTLEDVAQATHMRVHYLQALESNDIEALPSMVQARGFLRSYAEFLELDAEPLLLALSGEVSSEGTLPALEPTSETIQDVGFSEDAPEVIFIEIGQKLKHQRELLGLSLEDVERHTHLRIHNLQALEAGRIDDLPSPVQARGMLSNYAVFLGLDPEPLLLRFADGLQARLTQKQLAQRPSRPKSTRQPSRLPVSIRRIFSGELLVGTIVIIFLIGFVVWAAVRIFTLQTDQGEPPPTAPSIAEVLLATQTATTTPTQVPSTPTIPAVVPPTVGVEEDNTDEEPPLPGPGESVLVYITVRQRAWVRVIVDDEVVLSGRVLPGNAYNFAGDERVELLTGNGAALQVFFNQQDQGPLGLYGEVVHRVFTIDSIQTPTPTITSTPTVTPRATQTPRFTASP